MEIIDAFVGRCFDDFIIGFLFRNSDRARVAEFEYQHAAAHLGGPRVYGGRPLGAVHQPLRINGGHFRRRIAILRFVLRDKGVEETVVERWAAQNEALFSVITDGTECVD